MKTTRSQSKEPATRSRDDGEASSTPQLKQVSEDRTSDESESEKQLEREIEVRRKLREKLLRRKEKQAELDRINAEIIQLDTSYSLAQNS